MLNIYIFSHTTQSHYYVESLFSENNEILVIDRVTQDLKLSSKPRFSLIIIIHLVTHNK